VKGRLFPPNQKLASISKKFGLLWFWCQGLETPRC